MEVVSHIVQALFRLPFLQNKLQPVKDTFQLFASLLYLPSSNISYGLQEETTPLVTQCNGMFTCVHEGEFGQIWPQEAQLENPTCWNDTNNYYSVTVQTNKYTMENQQEPQKISKASQGVKSFSPRNQK